LVNNAGRLTEATDHVTDVMYTIQRRVAYGIQLMQASTHMPNHTDAGIIMTSRIIIAAALFLATNAALAQAPVVGKTETSDQRALLKSPVAPLADNKKLVFDFWREVLEAHHMELAEKYLAEDYIQHNPMVASGRKGFVDFFSKLPVRDIKPTISDPIVSIVAERDMVVLSFVQVNDDPHDKTKKYTTTWFDMFRIENGKIAEHWDCATRS
jgi:predicted SnoaL-like aldol condensation-catalyzing enzyme